MKTYNYKKNGFLFALLIILLIYKFFYLIPLEESFLLSTNIIIVVVTVIFCFLILVIQNKIEDGTYYFQKYVYFYLICLISEVIFTIAKYYNEPPVNAIKETFPYLIIFGYFVLSYYVQQNLKAFIRLLIVTADIMIVVLIIQSILLKSKNITFIQMSGFYYSGTQTLSIRDYGARLIGPYLIDFTSVVCLGLLFSKNTYNIRKKECIFNILLTLYYQLFIAQTRSSLLLLFSTFIVILIFRKYSIQLSKYFIIFILLLFLILLIPYFANQINYLITNQIDWSYYHRIDEFYYYWDQFIHSPIFGIGLLKDNPDYAGYLSIVKGITGYNSYSDIGIMGTMGRLGFIGLLFYWFIIVKFYKLFRKTKNIVILSMLVSIIISMINLSLFDAERLSVVIVYFALADGILRNFSEKNV